jgi:hypothetical protein
MGTSITSQRCNVPLHLPAHAERVFIIQAISMKYQTCSTQVVLRNVQAV